MDYPNPVLKKLGYTEKDRLAIIHTDDIGMCQASVSAFSDLWDFGIISSGAVMVPCPWFPEAAKMCREKPEMDMGVHLTLTSEWETYRWRPVSTRNPDSGLLDSEGFFPRTSEEVQKQGQPDAVAQEISAQVNRAVEAGINPTHIDSHMGSVFHGGFLPYYIQLSYQNRIPAMMFRMDRSDLEGREIDQDFIETILDTLPQLEAQGVPLLDDLVQVPLDGPTDAAERIPLVKQLLDALKPGITHFIIHPSKDTPELRAITPDWACRVADYQVFMSQEIKDYIRESGIQVIGYREIMQLMS